MPKKLISDIQHPLMSNIHLFVFEIGIARILAQKRSNTFAFSEGPAVSQNERYENVIAQFSICCAMKKKVRFGGIIDVRARADQTQ